MYSSDEDIPSSEVCIQALNQVFAGTLNVNDSTGIYGSVLVLLIENNADKIVEHFINQADLNYIEPESGFSYLDLTISHEQEKNAETLIRMGATITGQSFQEALRNCSEDFILRNFDLTQFDRNNTHFISEAFIKCYPTLLRQLIDLKYDFSKDILFSVLQNPSHDMEDFAIHFLENGAHIISTGYINHPLSIAIRSQFDRVASKILKTYHVDFNTFPNPSYLYLACLYKCINTIRILILEGHYYDSTIEKLNLPINIQRLLSAGYEKYPIRHSLTLNEVEFLDEDNYQRIMTTLTSMQIKYKDGQLAQLAPELIQLIINQLDVQFIQTPVQSNPFGPFNNDSWIQQEEKIRRRKERWQLRQKQERKKEYEQFHTEAQLKMQISQLMQQADFSTQSIPRM